MSECKLLTRKELNCCSLEFNCVHSSLNYSIIGDDRSLILQQKRFRFNCICKRDYLYDLGVFYGIFQASFILIYIRGGMEGPH